jgi:periplasmic divalent cation tolerance protein
MSDHVLVLMTAGSHEEAEALGHALVKGMLAACVNVVPGITSIYRWHDQVQRDTEWLLLAKTRRSALDAFMDRVRDLHSYDVPEILVLPILGGSPDYLRWLEDAVPAGLHAVD